MITTNETIALFLNEKIYISDENSHANKITSVESKEHKKTIYIVEGDTEQALDQAYIELISKMNTAIRYQPEEMQILCLEKATKLNISELKEIYQCDLIAIFGNFMSVSNSQLLVQNNKMMKINGVNVIQTNPIEEIHKDASIKNHYWNALKTILS